ncbi:hypothetical protein [Kaistella daneshvariae]|nr:hypothetical protein [Kaistella daneshvariae]
MGMFLSNYMLLQDLGYGKNGTDNFISEMIKSEGQKVLEQFNLFGFIIHDPIKNVEFHKKLEESFELLDYATGQHFLFFGLTTPPAQWIEKNKSREYFRIFGDHHLSPDKSPKLNDDSISAYTIANSMGISYNDLPVIVLTNNLKGKNIQVIKTCSKHLVEQLTRIGHYAAKSGKVRSLKKDLEFQQILKKINQCEGTESIDLENSVAKILSDFLAFVYSENSTYSLNGKIAKDHSTRFISKYLKGINSSKDLDQNEQANIKFLGYLSATIPEGGTADLGNGFEEESNILYRTYQKIFPVYGDLLRSFVSEQNNENLLDYSPLVICLAKIFETEIGLSLIHWCREAKGIEMPENFNKRKRKIGDVNVIPDSEFVSGVPRPINLNAGNGNKWKSPEIGSALLVAKTVMKSSTDALNFISNKEEFFTHWHKISTLRNNAAHPGTVSQERFNDFVNHFDYFKNGYFSDMNSLKHTLKNVNLNP